MRIKAVPPRSYRFFQSLWTRLRPQGQMRLLLAERKTADGTKLVAGSIFLKFGQTVFYAFTGCAPRDFYLHPHDLIQLEAIRDACKSGYRWYDFGEVSEDNESLAQFKGKWGTQPKPLFRYYYPLREEENSILGREITHSRKLWRLLPEGATAVLGDLIYRYM
jgi:lipid II:glycine glycyltransferase (peptidoglycan interpeptide bridge formation enzyme)